MKHFWYYNLSFSYWSVNKWISAYDNVCNIFGIITKLDSELLSETSAKTFINRFKDNTEETNIKQEIMLFSSYAMQINLPSNAP